MTTQLPDQEDPEEPTQLSAIKIFSLFEKAVQAVNTYPLTKKNIVIQQDAYKRLAVTEADDEWNAAEDVFATLDCSRKEKDTDMRFIIEFTASGASLSIESVGTFFVPFGTRHELFEDEKDVTTQIVATLKMLASGQIAALLTLRNDRWCATEVLLYEPGSRIPRVISTEASFPRRWRSRDETGYDTTVLRNNYLAVHMSTHTNILLIDRLPDGTLPLKGRVLETPEITPLTKGIYNYLIEEFNLRLAGKQEDESAWQMLYRSWETWTFFAFLMSLYFLGVEKGFLPHFILDAPIVTWPVTLFLMGAILIPLLQKKEQLRLHRPEHVWLRLDRGVHSLLRFLARLLMPGITTILVISTWWPIYFLPHTHQAVNLYQLAIPAAVMYAVPVLFGIAALASLVRTKVGAILSAVSVWAGVVLAFVINESASNASDDTPEPYSTITVSALLMALVVSVVIVWRRIKQPASEDLAESVRAEDEAQKMHRRLSILRYVGLVTCYCSAVLLAISAILFKNSLIPASIVYGQPMVIWLAIFAVALILAILTIGLNLKRLRQKEFYWIICVLFIGLMFGFGLSLKSGVEQGSNTAWMLLFGALFGPLIILRVNDALTNHLERQALKTRALGKDKKQSDANRKKDI